MYAKAASASSALQIRMVDSVHAVVALLAVSLGYFLRTVVPYLNARAKIPEIPFGLRYALLGLPLWLVSLWAALTTLDELPDLLQGGLGSTFLAYLLFAVAGNHVVFEALDKARGPTPEGPEGG